MSASDTCPYCLPHCPDPPCHAPTARQPICRAPPRGRWSAHATCHSMVHGRGDPGEREYATSGSGRWGRGRGHLSPLGSSAVSFLSIRSGKAIFAISSSNNAILASNSLCLVWHCGSFLKALLLSQFRIFSAETKLSYFRPVWNAGIFPDSCKNSTVPREILVKFL